VEKPAQVSSALTFDAETIKAAKKPDGTFETAVAPTLSTAPGYDGTITYTSSDAAVVTIDAATGALTLKGVGAATITASATETSSFVSSEASYTVIVYAIENGVFDFSMNNYGSEAGEGPLHRERKEVYQVKNNHPLTNIQILKKTYMKPTLETHKVMVNHIISASGMSYNATEDSLKGTLQETDATGASLTKERNVWNDQW